MTLPLRAAAHLVGHFVAGNTVPVAEFLKLFAVKLFRHLPQRIVSSLRVTKATQKVNQPLPGVRHLNPPAPYVSLLLTFRERDSRRHPRC